MQILTLTVRHLCVTPEMLSRWVSNYLTIQKIGTRQTELSSFPYEYNRGYSVSGKLCSYPQSPKLKLLINARKPFQWKMKMTVYVPSIKFGNASSSSQELNSSWKHLIEVHLNFIFEYGKNVVEGPRVTDNRCNLV